MPRQFVDDSRRELYFKPNTKLCYYFFAVEPPKENYKDPISATKKKPFLLDRTFSF